MKFRYETLHKDAKNRETSFIEELKKKESENREQTNFFDSTMDDLKQRHADEIERISARVVRRETILNGAHANTYIIRKMRWMKNTRRTSTHRLQRCGMS